METSTSLGEVAGAPPESVRARRRLVALALLFSLFFLWGVANNLNDILIRQFKKAFELTDFQSGLVQSAFYLGYFLFALPAALFLRWRGYKAGIVLGLSLYAAGALLFYPAANARGYGFFLLALFVIASGLSFLETSANPFVTLLGPAQSAERRLNFAQAFNPLGSITGVLIGRLFIFSGNEYTPEQLARMSTAARDAYYAAESVAVQQPYLVIGLVVGLLALVFKLTPFPPTGPGHERAGTGLLQGLRILAGKRSFVVAVLAQFFYVGAQVGIWSYSIRYAQATIPGTPEKIAADYLILSLVVFMIGRFVGTALMKGIAPAKLLATFALINAFLAVVAMLLPGHIGLWALIATSFFMSIMFPTIFALGLRNVGDARELASSFLVMAIIGGAILTPVMGAISGQLGIQWSMVVPLLAFAVVLGFAISNRSAEA